MLDQDIERLVTETRCDHNALSMSVCELSQRVDADEHRIMETGETAEDALSLAKMAHRRLDEMTNGPEEPEPQGDPWDMPVRILRPVPKANGRRPHPRRGTVCLWKDGTVTHAEPSRDTPYDPFIGLAVCLLKRLVALDPTARKHGHKVIVAGVSMSNRIMGLTYGADSESSYKLAVMAAGSGLYVRMLPRALECRYSNKNASMPETFWEYVRDVMDYEAKGIAKRIADDFTRRLLQARKEASIRDWNERHRRELEERRAIVRKEAEANGASAFEAWKYAVEMVPAKKRPFIRGRISEQEAECIRKEALADARYGIERLREVVTFDTTPSI